MGGGRGAFLGYGSGGGLPPPFRCWRAVELVVGEQVGDGDGFVAAWTSATGAEAAAPPVAVFAALLAEVAGVAGVAVVDGVGLGDDRFDGSGSFQAPGGLAAGG
jgi:hypothetical protein